MGSKSNARMNSLRTDALRHSCNVGESAYDNSSPLNLNNIPLSLHRVHVDEDGLGISFPSRAAAGGRVLQATVADRPREETLVDSC